MGLRDDILAESRSPGARCRVEVILADMEAFDREQLLEVINDPSVSSSAISRYLKKTGTEIAEGSISRHRRGGCRCVNA